MTERCDKLKTLVRLRRRDVDRRSREVAQAAKALAMAEADHGRALSGLAGARVAQDRALAQRLAKPADALVAVHCRTTELRIAEAEESLRLAEAGIAAATEALVERRARWLRAQARLDALETLLRRAVTADRRAADRRRTEDAPAASPPLRLALA